MPGIADKFTQSARGRLLWPGMTDVDGSIDFYADFSNSSRPISMRRISLVPAPIS
jgi:hypothetical protein